MRPMPQRKIRWINRTVLGIGLASLFSDASHEMATTIMPAFLATMGVAAGWLGLIEGVSDGLSSFAKLASGYYTDHLQRRKPIAILGYALTTVGVAAFGLATAAWQVLVCAPPLGSGAGYGHRCARRYSLRRCGSRKLRARVRFERMMDTLGAVIAPAVAWFLLRALHHNYANLFVFTLVPGVLAISVIAVLVKEKETRSSSTYLLRFATARASRCLSPISVSGWAFWRRRLRPHNAHFAGYAETDAHARSHTRSQRGGCALFITQCVLCLVRVYRRLLIADRFKKNIVLVLGYSMAALMAIAIITLPVSLWTFSLIFILGGTNVALEETAEDSFCAELVKKEHRWHGFWRAGDGQRRRRFSVERDGRPFVDCVWNNSCLWLQRRALNRRRAACRASAPMT